jgi:hypothetical protein
VEVKLTKYQYFLLRYQAKSKNTNLHPAYQKLLKAKNLCCCAEESIKISVSSAEVNMQALLDHTICCAIFSQEKLVETISLINFSKMLLVSK